MNTKTTWCALGATILLATACTTAAPNPDPAPADTTTKDADPATAPILDDATRASIDAFFEAEVNDSMFVPIYIGERGVAVDGKDAVRFDPETGRFADADRKGGPSSLYIIALKAPFEAASEARPLSAEKRDLQPFLDANVYVEAWVPYQTFVELLYTAGQTLGSTGPEGEGDRMVSVSLGGYGPRLKIVSRDAGAWRGYNASLPALAVGPPDDEPLEEEPLELTIAIGAEGFRVMAAAALVPPIAGCPADGPTVCNEGGADASELIARVASTKGAERDAALAELVAVYDMHSLYNTALRIKGRYPDDTVVTVVADGDVPFALVSAVVDAVRDRRDSGNAKGYFADDAAFEAAAPPVRSFSSSDGLFPDPVFGIAR
jgi:hypothetical protein